MNKGIQGIKGLFCIFILLFHYTYRYQILYNDKLTSWSFENGSNIGVTFFFVLSGYYFQKSVQKFNGDYLSFIKKKLLSLYPAFVLCLSLTLLVKLLNGNNMGGALLDYFLNLIFIRLNLEGATWYLRVLLILYLLLFPLTKNRLYKYIIIFMEVLLVLLNLFDCSAFMNNNVLNSLPKFLCGICLSFAIDKNIKTTMLVGILLSLVLNKYMPFVCSISFTIIICGLLLNKSCIQFVFSNKILLFLGNISYVMYLLHQNIGYIIISQMRDLNFNGNTILFITILIIITISYILNIICRNIDSFIKRKCLITHC